MSMYEVIDWRTTRVLFGQPTEELVELSFSQEENGSARALWDGQHWDIAGPNGRLVWVRMKGKL